MIPTPCKTMLLLGWALALPQAATALDNPLLDASRTVTSGQLRFAFAAREGVEGDGHTVRIHSGTRTMWQNDRGWDSRDWCDPCDLQVTMTYRDGEVRRVRWRVGGHAGKASDDVQDLGRVDATQARDFLMQVVATGEERVAEEALEAAVLSQAQVPWQELLRLARDDARARDLRSTALFWVGQEAQDVVTAELEDFVEDDVEDRDVRQAALFALSQRPESESIPSLKRIAQHHRDPELRRNALFWLAQMDAPEVMDFFEEILSESRSR